MNMSQSGKVALVTGGAQGIGRAFVESLLAEGASVAICDMNEDVGRSAAKELISKYGDDRVLFIKCDVTDDQQFEGCFKAAIDKFAYLDIVVNNAGTANERNWKKVVDLNFKAVVVGTQLGMKYMDNNSLGRGGTVVNIASITSLEAWPTIPVYSATKAAVNQYSRSMGNELYFNKTGVKVVSVNPGMTDTALTTGSDLNTMLQDGHVEPFIEHFGKFHLQKVGNMGTGLIKVLQEGKNGQLWTIEDDQPAKLTVLT